MSVKQLSVFAENKHGSLYEITKILSEAGIDIRAFSVADTHSYGVLRLIVSDTRHAAFALSSEGKIESRKLRDGNLEAEDYAKLAEAASALA